MPFMSMQIDKESGKMEVKVEGDEKLRLIRQIF